jgi:hypothetical protein
VGGFFFYFEAVRTASRDHDALASHASRRWRLHETAPPRRRRRGRQRVYAARECTETRCRSAQVGDELKPGLIDFGQCTTLTKPQLRTVCQLVVLLRTRSQTLIDQALRGSGFGFNTEDPELKLALSYLRVLKCWGAFTPSTRLMSISQ